MGDKVETGGKGVEKSSYYWVGLDQKERVAAFAGGLDGRVRAVVGTICMSLYNDIVHSNISSKKTKTRVH